MGLTLVFEHGCLVFEILLLLGLDYRRLEQFVGVGSLFGIDIKHLLDNGPQLHRVTLWNSLDLARTHSFEQPFHARCLERRLQRDHLVQHAAQRPNITLYVVWFVLPHFWTRVIRGSGLSEVKSIFGGHLAHVHVAQFD